VSPPGETVSEVSWRLTASVTPIGGSAGTAAGSAARPGAASTGGRCPALDITVAPVLESMTAYSTVAIASGSKYCILRSSRVSTSAGLGVSSV